MPSREGKCVRMRARRTLTEDELRTVESFELSSRYNEVMKLCYNDPGAWDECVRTALCPHPLTEHFVRRSTRKVGPVGRSARRIVPMIPKLNPNPGRRGSPRRS